MAALTAGGLELSLGRQWSAAVEIAFSNDMPSGAVYVRRHFELDEKWFLAAQVGLQRASGSSGEEVELAEYVEWSQETDIISADVGGVATFRPWRALALTVGYGVQLTRLAGQRECHQTSNRFVPRDTPTQLEIECMNDGDFEPPKHPVVHSLTAALQVGHPNLGLTLHAVRWLNPRLAKYSHPTATLFGGGLYAGW